jgi:hypothetical protein
MGGGSGMQAQTIDVRGAGGELHVVRDLLDKQLVDRHHDPLGRADGLIMVVADGAPPRLATVESGIGVLGDRLGRPAGRCVRAVARWWGLRRGVPLRIRWAQVVKVGIEVELDLDASATPALAWEHWLDEHVVRYVPSLKPADKKKHAPHDDAKAETPPAPPGNAVPRGKRIRIHKLLNRRVLDAGGKPVGRIEELRARVRDGACVVEEYVLGREGLMERLSVSELSLVALGALGARRGFTGQRVAWEQMDLSDPHRPRLRSAPGDSQGGGSA